MRVEINEHQPLWISPSKTLYPSWTMGGNHYIMIILPCSEEAEYKVNKGPGYLFRVEHNSGKGVGYYTDVYRAQYIYGQGFEPMFFNIKNSKDDCGIDAYRGLDDEQGEHLIPIQSETVDLKEIFVCRLSGYPC